MLNAIYELADAAQNSVLRLEWWSFYLGLSHELVSWLTIGTLAAFAAWMTYFINKHC